MNYSAAEDAFHSHTAITSHFYFKMDFHTKAKNLTPDFMSCNRCQDKVSMCEGIDIIVGRFNMEDPVCGILLPLPSNLRI